MMNKVDKTSNDLNKKKNLTLNFNDKGEIVSNNRTGINYIPEKVLK